MVCMQVFNCSFSKVCVFLSHKVCLLSAIFVVINGVCVYAYLEHHSHYNAFVRQSKSFLEWDMLKHLTVCFQFIQWWQVPALWLVGCWCMCFSYSGLVWHYCLSRTSSVCMLLFQLKTDKDSFTLTLLSPSLPTFEKESAFSYVFVR